MSKGYFADPVSNEKFLPESQGSGTGTTGKDWDIYVAASDAPQWQKDIADVVCDGVNDELTIQSACDNIYTNGGGTLRLSRGTFFVDSFPNYEENENGEFNQSGGTHTAILLKSNDTTGYEIRIIGDSFVYGLAGGTKILVRPSVYESLDSNNRYKIFAARYGSSGLMGKCKISLFMMYIAIRLPYNQKRIMCIDLLYVNRVYMQFVRCTGYTTSYNGGQSWSNTSPYVPIKAIEGCVGIRMTGGSNAGTCNDYKNVNCSGFYEGFKVGGEHVIGINLGASHNVYGFTFGNYKWKHFSSHPITLIHCGDELNARLPLFAYNGYNRNNFGGQEINLISYDLECIPHLTPGGQIEQLAQELVAGTFNGRIDYTIFTDEGGVSGNITNMRFWKHGHGHRFESRDCTQLLATTKNVLATYEPNYLQKVWLTDENKMVHCIDTENKTWVDSQGNTVSLN